MQGFIDQHCIIQGETEREECYLLWANNISKYGLKPKLEGFGKKFVTCCEKDYWPPIVKILNIPFLKDKANEPFSDPFVECLILYALSII